MWSRFIAVLLMLCLASSTVLAKPRLSIVDARKIALARVPGKIVHEKLKKKKKEADQYMIKIVPLTNAKPHFLEKLTIDGDTGKILKIKQVAAKPPKDDDDSSD